MFMDFKCRTLIFPGVIVDVLFKFVCLGLESVTHLPIVAAAVGILIQLILKSSGKG